MQIAIRPFLLTGLAFGGAAMVALTPIKPNLPDIQMPAISTPALELAALPSYIKWVQEGTYAETKNIPSWQQPLDADLNGALSAAVELGSSLFQHLLTTAAEMPEGGDAASSATAPQTPQEFIDTVQAILTNANFLPTIMDDLVQVVQNVAANTVEPVLDLVLRVTFSTLYRASNIMKATFRDIPAIAVTTFDAGGQIIKSLVDGLAAVGNAAMTDPLTILDVLTDRVLHVGAVIADQAIRVIDAVDTYRRDLESALLTPPTPQNPPAASSVSEPAPPDTLAARSAPAAGSLQIGGYDLAVGNTTAADSTRSSAASSDEVVSAPPISVIDIMPTNDPTPAESATPTRNPGLGQSNKPNRPSISDESGPAEGKTGAKAGPRPHSPNR